MATVATKRHTRNGSSPPPQQEDWSFFHSVYKAGCAQVHEERQMHADVIWKNYSQVEKAAMAEASGMTGGYLAPLEYSLAIFESLAEHSFLWNRCLKVPMTSRTTDCPAFDSTSTATAGVSPFFGGMRFYWNSKEGSSLNESEPLFKQVTLTAWDLIGELLLSNQFFADIGPVGADMLAAEIGKAAAWYSEYGFLQGTGSNSSMALGILNSSALISATRATANQIALGDVNEMASKLIPSSWDNAIWACSPSALIQLFAITGFVPNQLSHQEAHDPSVPPNSVGTLLSRPLFVTSKLPALGTAGDLLLFDPHCYVIGDRQQVFVEASPHPRFTNMQTVLRVTLRCDGKPRIDNSVTLADGQTASAFVALDAGP